MKLKYSGFSETGSVRKHNEDAFLMREGNGSAIFLVADGIGGGEHGEVVSGMLRDRFSEWWDNKTWDVLHRDEQFSACLEEIKELLDRINQEVVQRYGEYRAGSTVVILFLLGSICALFSAGDSRIYKMRAMRCQQVTRDDTYENLSRDWAERYGTSASGKLVSAVGITTRLEYSIRTERVNSGDAFFLCSDGVYRYITEKKLKRRLTWDRLVLSQDQLSRKLRTDIEEGGSGDNYTLILVETH